MKKIYASKAIVDLKKIDHKIDNTLEILKNMRQNRISQIASLNIDDAISLVNNDRKQCYRWLVEELAFSGKNGHKKCGAVVYIEKPLRMGFYLTTSAQMITRLDWYRREARGFFFEKDGIQTLGYCLTGVSQFSWYCDEVIETLKKLSLDLLICDEISYKKYELNQTSKILSDEDSKTTEDLWKKIDKESRDNMAGKKVESLFKGFHLFGSITSDRRDKDHKIKMHKTTVINFLSGKKEENEGPVSGEKVYYTPTRERMNWVEQNHETWEARQMWEPSDEG